MNISVGDVFIVPSAVFNHRFVIVRVEGNPGASMTTVSQYSRDGWARPAKRKIDLAGDGIPVSLDASLPQLLGALRAAGCAYDEAVKAAERAHKAKIRSIAGEQSK